MTMDTAGLLIALVFGTATGLFYFMGLWWTVQKLPESRWPGLWVVSSYLIRTAVSVLAFYLAMGGHWQRLVVSLLGFVATRMVLMRRLKPVNSGQ
jgi:F1F0 ATPase subunit 2